MLTAFGVVCALGSDKKTVLANALRGDRSGLVRRDDLHFERPVVVGEARGELVSLDRVPSDQRTRNNQLALTAFTQIEEDVRAVVARVGADRVGVVIGTSTSGIAEGEAALREHHERGEFPSWFRYAQQEMAAPARFIADWAGLTGPCYAVSTACSSSARALGSARAMLLSGLADAVVVGGVDSLCRLTVNGFSALEAMAQDYCQPFSKNRDGINIGEGAGLFLMQREGDGVRLAGVGASSDAHHMSAPKADGSGAQQAILQACEQAGIGPAELDYINLHGTGTPLNDSMESNALAGIGADRVAASSTKGMTGHTLGAAGAIECGLCWLILSPFNQDGCLIPHCWDGVTDPDLAPIQLISRAETTSAHYCLSNSFAFGGNNVSVVLAR
ncbi:beta-ketoacyl-[acyl-carrier-protein] synthase family protein [Aliidiomarina sp. Khilg15.8]